MAYKVDTGRDIETITNVSGYYVSDNGDLIFYENHPYGRWERDAFCKGHWVRVHVKEG